MNNIDRISLDTDFTHFDQKYFTPGIPVIIQNVTDNWLATKKWSYAFLKEQLNKDNNQVTQSLLWYETAMQYLQSDYEIPKIVMDSLSDDICYKRDTNCRLWIHAKGNVTSFHYDGNALFVFNVQVIGKKRWIIVSPDSDLNFYSFLPIPYLKYNQLFSNQNNHNQTENIGGINSKHIYEFDLNAGEMLFLPPFWTHRVVALDDENININWVGTKKILADSKIFKRETEILTTLTRLEKLGLTSRFPFLNNYLKNYGGGGKEFIDMLTNNIGDTVLVKRLLLEIIKLPFTLRDQKILKSTYKKDPFASFDKS